MIEKKTAAPKSRGKVIRGKDAINADLKRRAKQHEIRAMLAETQREQEAEKERAASINRTILFLERLDKQAGRTTYTCKFIVDD